MSDAYLDQCFYCYEDVHHSDEYLICSNKECEVVCHRDCYEQESDELFCCSNACVKKAGNGKKKKSKGKKWKMGGSSKNEADMSKLIQG